MTADDTDRQPWDMRDDETAKAFGAFTAYRDMGSSRSLRRLAESGNNAASNLRQMAKWSGEHDWPDRAAAWDRHVDREVQDDQVEAIKIMRRRHAAIAAGALAKVGARISTIDADRLTVNETARLMEVAYKMERIARGEPGETTGEADGLDPMDGHTLPGEDVLDMIASNPDLAALADGLAAAGAIDTDEQETT